MQTSAIELAPIYPCYLGNISVYDSAPPSQRPRAGYTPTPGGGYRPTPPRPVPGYTPTPRRLYPGAYVPTPSYPQYQEPGGTEDRVGWFCGREDPQDIVSSHRDLTIIYKVWIPGEGTGFTANYTFISIHGKSNIKTDNYIHLYQCMVSLIW